MHMMFFVFVFSGIRSLRSSFENPETKKYAGQNKLFIVLKRRKENIFPLRVAWKQKEKLANYKDIESYINYYCSFIYIFQFRKQKNVRSSFVFDQIFKK